MTPVALATLALVLVVALVIVAVSLCRSTSDPVAARLRELEALPAPDEIPTAPDPTRSQRRAHTRRDHPIARKHRNGDWS